MDLLNILILRAVSISNPFQLKSFVTPTTGNAIAGAIANRVVEILLFLLLPIAVVGIIYTAYQLITSNGKPDVYEKAKKNLIGLLIGIFLIVSSVTLSQWFYTLVS